MAVLGTQLPIAMVATKGVTLPMFALLETAFTLAIEVDCRRFRERIIIIVCADKYHSTWKAMALRRSIAAVISAT